MHEFGHALGFHHEFTRPDNHSCSGSDPDGPAPGSDPNVSYLGTPHDSSSIMYWTYYGECFPGPTPADISGTGNACPGEPTGGEWDIWGKRDNWFAQPGKRSGHGG